MDLDVAQAGEQRVSGLDGVLQQVVRLNCVQDRFQEDKLMIKIYDF